MQPAETTSESPAESGAVKPKRRTWRRRLGRGFVLYVITPYVAVTVILTLLQRRFLYPATTNERITASLAGLPSASARDVELQASNGLTLRGWHLKTGRTAADALPLLVVYFPGNAGNRIDRAADCREFAHLGCDVLLFDYRGYGDNPGSPSEAAIADDARRIWKYATVELAVPADRIIIFGESLGGAVATGLAQQQCDAGTPPAALILNATFASLPETVGWHYPYFPFRWLLFDRWPSIERIGRVSCPILQFHGTQDDFVPIEHARRLFAATREVSSGGVPRRFVEFPGASHNDVPTGIFRREVVSLLDEMRDGQ